MIRFGIEHKKGRDFYQIQRYVRSNIKSEGWLRTRMLVVDRVEDPKLILELRRLLGIINSELDEEASGFSYENIEAWEDND